MCVVAFMLLARRKDFASGFRIYFFFAASGYKNRVDLSNF